MKFVWGLLLWLLVSCASSPSQNLLRTQVLRGNYNAAKETLEKSDIKLKERNQFLYYLEKGQIEFLAGNYREAIIPWEKARELLKGYYRQKLGDKILTGIANSNLSDFHGEIFEQHQFFFHLSLAYLRISQQKDVESRDKIRALASARAALLDWDSFIKGLHRNGIKAFYKESFLARFYASFLHEVIGSREDLQIAFQLMKDAKGLMKFGDFKVLGPKINKMMGESLVRLALKLGRKKEVSKFSKEYKLNAKEVELYPAIFLIDRGMIAAKKAETVPFGLQYALNNPSRDVRGNLLNIGMTVLSGFSNGVLGLGYQEHRYRRSGYVRYRYRVSGSAIEFEMPVRAESTPTDSINPGQLQLSLITKEATGEAQPKTINPKFLFSVSELSRAAIDHDFEDIYFRTGLRASMKYLAAIISAYKLYRSMTKSKGKNPRNSNPNVGGGNVMARFATTTSFALAVAAIRASERADTRYWSTLPDHLLIKNMDLKPGQYQLAYQGNNILEFEKKAQTMELFSFSMRNLENIK